MLERARQKMILLACNLGDKCHAQNRLFPVGRFSHLFFRSSSSFDSITVRSPGGLKAATNRA